VTPPPAPSPPLRPTLGRPRSDTVDDRRDVVSDPQVVGQLTALHVGRHRVEPGMVTARRRQLGLVGEDDLDLVQCP
jgi:hypothetical protein